MSQQYLQKKDIQGQNLLNKAKTYMSDKFGQIAQMFSYSTGYGQIQLNISNHSKLVFYYIKDSINEMSFKTARRKDSIYGMAQLNGHNAHRGFGATGTITVSLKSDGLLNQGVSGGLIYVPNFTRLRCADNGLLYYLNLGQEYIEITGNTAHSFTANILQGVVRSDTFTGDGTDNQTYSVTFNNLMVDMNHIKVEVNGNPCKVVSTFSEFEYGKLCCIVRTGLTAGIDLIFGKKIYSTIPEGGEEIRVYYPVIAGKLGNVKAPIFSFIDPFYNQNGNAIDVNKTYDIKVIENPDFGAEAEDIELTKLIAPNVNKNSIIFDKKSLKYTIDRMNLFGSVKIFNDTQANVLDTYIYPRLEDMVGVGQDYFNMNRNDIVLSDVTKTRLLGLINSQRSQNIDVVIKDPVVKSYSMVVKADVYKTSGSDLTKMKEDIRTVISNSMLKMRRTNKIPKSDIVKLVDDMNIVDSVDVEFIVEDQSMLDSIGNIIVKNKEIALPSNNFIDGNGNQVLKAIVIDLTYSE